MFTSGVREWIRITNRSSTFRQQAGSTGRSSARRLTQTLGTYMYSSRMFIILLSLSLVACTSTPVKESTVKTISPVQAIMSAAETAPHGVSGVFEMQVKSTGRKGNIIYLNSETDYRDQRCLTLVIHRNVVPGFVQKYGEDPDTYLKSKMVHVSGELWQFSWPDPRDSQSY